MTTTKAAKAAKEITSHDVSVVVQGALAPGGAQGATGRCLQSVRRSLPGAEIILSTYKGSDTNGLVFDRLVKSDDPGAVVFTHPDFPKQYNNVNRQIVTSQAGLKRATRPYALKLRNDLLLEGDRFLRCFTQFPAQNAAFAGRVFDERLLNCTRYARNPRRALPYAFHPSDWFFFGKTSDVQKLFDIPLAPEPQTSRWFDGFAPRPDPDIFAGALNRWTPEQYLWLTCLKNHLENGGRKIILPDYQWDISKEITEASERSLAENFVLLSPRQLQIRFTKYRMTHLDWASVYTHGEWLRLYRTYCCADACCADACCTNDAAAMPKLPFDWEAAAKRAFIRILILPEDAPIRRILRVLRQALPRAAYEKCWKAYRRILE